MDDFIQICTIHIDYKEWQDVISKYGYFRDSVSTTRPIRFYSAIQHYLTEITQTHGMHCYYQCISNYFKHKAESWYGNFTCIDKSCNVKFKFESDTVSVCFYNTYM